MPKRSYVVGISGGTCSGKTALALALQAELGQDSSTVLGMDSYFIYPNPSLINYGKVNFDHPNAIDIGLFKEHFVSLINGAPILSPVYDRYYSKPVGNQLIAPTEIIVIEGLFVLWDNEIRSRLNLKVFLDTDADIRLGRRMIRDIIEYGLDVREVCQNYVEVARPMHMQFTEPTKNYANVILRWPVSIQDEVTTLLKIISRSVD